MIPHKLVKTGRNDWLVQIGANHVEITHVVFDRDEHDLETRDAISRVWAETNEATPTADEIDLVELAISTLDNYYNGGLILVDGEYRVTGPMGDGHVVEL